MSRRRGRRKGKPQAVGQMLDSVLGDLGLGAAAQAFRIGERWAEAVGPDVARHARPVGVRGGVLEVSVDSSVWCQQLQLRKGEILAALSRVMAEDAPADLRLRVGYTPRP